MQHVCIAVKQIQYESEMLAFLMRVDNIELSCTGRNESIKLKYEYDLTQMCHGSNETAVRVALAQLQGCQAQLV